MPLKKGKSQKIIGGNIKELMEKGRPQKASGGHRTRQSRKEQKEKGPIVGAFLLKLSRG